MIKIRCIGAYDLVLTNVDNAWTSGACNMGANCISEEGSAYGCLIQTRFDLLLIISKQAGVHTLMTIWLHLISPSSPVPPSSSSLCHCTLLPLFLPCVRKFQERKETPRSLIFSPMTSTRHWEEQQASGRCVHIYRGHTLGGRHLSVANPRAHKKGNITFISLCFSYSYVSSGKRISFG